MNHKEYKEEEPRNTLKRRKEKQGGRRPSFSLLSCISWLNPSFKSLRVAGVLCGSFVSSVALAAPPKKSAPPVRRVVSPWDVEAREYLGTPQSEEAVRRGLAFLASRQTAQGYWPRDGYRGNVGITGLCVMAFLAAGHQPGRGRYGLVLNQAVDYLANSVLMDGSIYKGYIHGAEDSAPPMYGHGYATLALAEAYGMTRRRDLRDKLASAVHLIENTQNQSGDPRVDGGWRYQPNTSEADISVTVVQLMALRGARNAGLKVSQPVIDRALAYMKRCATNDDGGLNYQVGRHESGPARTSAAILSFIMAGQGNVPECQRALDYIKNNPIYQTRSSGRTFGWREHFYYCLYYLTQAMYQVGGDRWKDWYPTVRDYLISTQKSSGYWSDNSEAGVDYATAMAALVLEVPAGLLPIYQK